MCDTYHPLGDDFLSENFGWQEVLCEGVEVLDDGLAHEGGVGAVVRGALPEDFHQLGQQVSHDLVQRSPVLLLLVLVYFDQLVKNQKSPLGGIGVSWGKQRWFTPEEKRD